VPLNVSASNDLFAERLARIHERTRLRARRFPCRPADVNNVKQRRARARAQGYAPSAPLHYVRRREASARCHFSVAAPLRAAFCTSSRFRDARKYAGNPEERREAETSKRNEREIRACSRRHEQIIRSFRVLILSRWIIVCGRHLRVENLMTNNARERGERKGRVVVNARALTKIAQRGAQRWGGFPSGQRRREDTKDRFFNCAFESF